MGDLGLLLTPALTALGVCTANVLSQVRRSKRFQTPVDLTPNLLMTRYPLVFVHGPKSLFHFYDYWNGLPKFMFEHGYETYEWDLPWKNTTSRVQALVQNLSAMDGSAHFILAEDVEPELIDELKRRRNQVTTINLLKEPPDNYHPEPFLALHYRDWGNNSNSRFDMNWALHQLTLGRKRLASLPPYLTPHPSPQRSKVERRFLDLGVELAEKDFKCSD